MLRVHPHILCKYIYTYVCTYSDVYIYHIQFNERYGVATIRRLLKKFFFAKKRYSTDDILQKETYHVYSSTTFTCV